MPPGKATFLAVGQAYLPAVLAPAHGLVESRQAGKPAPRHCSVRRERSTAMSEGPDQQKEARRWPWWLPLCAVVVSCLYLPTLATRFDFNDDGCLAYPIPAASLDQELRIVWLRTLQDFRGHGPF